MDILCVGNEIWCSTIPTTSVLSSVFLRPHLLSSGRYCVLVTNIGVRPILFSVYCFPSSTFALKWSLLCVVTNLGVRPYQFSVLSSAFLR